jgi:hypothetical protein
MIFIIFYYYIWFHVVVTKNYQKHVKENQTEKYLICLADLVEKNAWEK